MTLGSALMSRKEVLDEHEGESNNNQNTKAFLRRFLLAVGDRGLAGLAGQPADGSNFCDHT